MHLRNSPRVLSWHVSVDNARAILPHHRCVRSHLISADCDLPVALMCINPLLRCICEDMALILRIKMKTNRRGSNRATPWYNSGIVKCYTCSIGFCRLPGGVRTTYLELENIRMIPPKAPHRRSMNPLYSLCHQW